MKPGTLEAMQVAMKSRTKARVEPEAIDSVLATVPPLPQVVRYYDDFSDSYAQVADPEKIRSVDDIIRWTSHNIEGRTQVYFDLKIGVSLKLVRLRSGRTLTAVTVRDTILRSQNSPGRQY